MSEKVLRKAQGMEYEVNGNKVTIYPADQDPITVELELGKSVYSTVQKVAKSLLKKEPKPREVGNFTFKVEDGVVTIYRKDGSVLTVKELAEKDLHNVKVSVMKIIVKEVQ